jgi:glycosyltransferase involved in cell wall biosynthesis
MRILQVITSLHTGGAEKLIVDLVPRLRALGHDVDVCLFNGEETTFKKQLRGCGCTIYELSDSDHYYNPLWVMRLLRIMRDYDIVHTHNTAPQLFASIAGLFCSAKLVTTEHSTSNRRRGWKWYKCIDRWMYNRYRIVICISQKAENNLKDYLGHYNTDIVTIYNGVDVEAFHQANPNNSLRRTNRFVIVMVAGFRYQKDHETLVKAISLLDKDTYELWLVGDGDRRPLIEKMVTELGLQNNVVFWGVRFDIPELLHTADVVVMSSHLEGLSLSNIEGMCVGKPFIASDVDGLREMTEGAGILFPHQDYQRLAEIITELHDNKTLYEKTAQACYNRAKQFDISKMVQSYSKVYQSLV